MGCSQGKVEHSITAGPTKEELEEEKRAEEENLAKQEETIALKKKADALRAQENNIFRQKCQSYEKLLCDVEGFIVDLQQQIIVSCKPLASEKRKRAQTLIQRTPFEKMKPALSIILQRYPEMLNSITREVYSLVFFFFKICVFMFDSSG